MQVILSYFRYVFKGLVLTFLFLVAVNALSLMDQETQGTGSWKYFSKFQGILEEFLHNIHGLNCKSQTC